MFSKVLSCSSAFRRYQLVFFFCFALRTDMIVCFYIHEETDEGERPRKGPPQPGQPGTGAGGYRRPSA